MAKKVLVKDNKVLSLHSGKVLGAPENYDLDTYLNFYMPFGGTITLRRRGSPTVVELEYSTDGCRTWQIWEEVGTDRTVELPAEGRVWIRNTSETSTRFSTSGGIYYRFIFSKITFAYGRISSLLCKNPNNAVLVNNAFRVLFYGAKLATSPILDFENVNYQYSYSEMFAESACIRIITYMKSISSNALAQWVAIVAKTGDFYCPSELTIPTGTSGIPSGWTRHDLSELE